MTKGKEYISTYPDNPPEWYWVHRLHYIVDLEGHNSYVVYDGRLLSNALVHLLHFLFVTEESTNNTPLHQDNGRRYDIFET